MTASCYNIVRGKMVRVTRLDSCGNFPVPTTANSFVTSSGFISVAYTTDYENGTEIIQKTADGVLCVNDKTCDQFKRLEVKVSFCGVDPDLLSIITSNSVELDAAGNDVGFRISEGVACSNFALELWTGLGGPGECPLSNQVYTLTEGGSGLTSFTLTITPSGGSAITTASIVAAATAAQVAAAIQAALDPIGTGDVAVTGATSGPYTVTFQGKLAGRQVTVTAPPTGGTGTVPPAVVTTGGVATNGQYGYLLLPFVKNGTLRDLTVGLSAT